MKNQEKMKEDKMKNEEKENQPTDDHKYLLDAFPLFAETVELTDLAPQYKATGQVTRRHSFRINEREYNLSISPAQMSNSEGISYVQPLFDDEYYRFPGPHERDLIKRFRRLADDLIGGAEAFPVRELRFSDDFLTGAEATGAGSDDSRQSAAAAYDLLHSIRILFRANYTFAFDGKQFGFRLVESFNRVTEAGRTDFIVEPSKLIFTRANEARSNGIWSSMF